MKKLHRSYRRLKNETAHGFKPKRHLWSENVGYPHPSACHPHLSTSQRDSAHRKTLRNAARRSATKKEDPPKRAFLQESSEQNRCTTTSS